MRVHHLCAAIALLVALSIGMRYCSTAAYLDSIEMKACRGGAAQARDCTTSCNAWNGFINQCLMVGANCTLCNLGGFTVHYLDMAGPTCSANGGFTYSPTRNQQCGAKLGGQCIALGVCNPVINLNKPCTAPPVVCPQGNCP